MEQNKSNNRVKDSEEINLGQLFQLMGHAFNRFFKGILILFLYLKRRAVILGILIVIGVVVGVTLSGVVTKRKKIEVIVQPNLESKNYLYDAVAEVQSNIEAGDAAFFKELGIDSELSAFEITVERIGTDDKITEEETAYLEMLLSSESSALISDVVRAEILNKTSFSHKITFYFKDQQAGELFASRVIDYLNSNKYYGDLVDISKQNIITRIDRSEGLISQIDAVINNFSQRMASETTSVSEGQIVLENEKPLDITGLISLKNSLIRDIENKKIELVETNQPIEVINFGKPQQVKKMLFARYKFLIPLLFLGLFFAVEFVLYLNRKAREL